VEDVLHRRAHVGDQRGQLGHAAGPVTHFGGDADEPAVGGEPTLDHAAERGHVDVAAAQRDDHLRAGRYERAGRRVERRASRLFPLELGRVERPAGEERGERGGATALDRLLLACAEGDRGALRGADARRGLRRSRAFDEPEHGLRDALLAHLDRAVDPLARNREGVRANL